MVSSERTVDKWYRVFSRNDYVSNIIPLTDRQTDRDKETYQDHEVTIVTN